MGEWRSDAKPPQLEPPDCVCNHPKSYHLAFGVARKCIDCPCNLYRPVTTPQPPSPEGVRQFRIIGVQTPDGTLTNPDLPPGTKVVRATDHDAAIAEKDAEIERLKGLVMRGSAPIIVGEEGFAWLADAAVQREVDTLRARVKDLEAELNPPRPETKPAMSRPPGGGLIDLIEAMDQKMTRMGSGEFVESYVVPAGPWHRILGIVRGGTL